MAVLPEESIVLTFAAVAVTYYLQSLYLALLRKECLLRLEERLEHLSLEVLA